MLEPQIQTSDRSPTSLTPSSSRRQSWKRHGGAAILFSLFANPLFAQKLLSPEFVAQPIDGDAVTGRLVGFEKSWRITLQAADRRPFDGIDLVSLRRKDRQPSASVSGPQVLLANGDRLRATPNHATQETLRVHSELLGDLEIPLERVQAVVFHPPSDPAAREGLIGRLTTGKRKHDLVILANGDELSGTFLSMDDMSVRLDGSQGAIEISRSGIRALVLSSDLISFPLPKELYAKVYLSDGTELSLVEAWLTAANLRGRAAVGREVTMPMEQLVAVEFRNGRLTFLSDLEPAAYRHTPYLGLPFTFQQDRTVTGNLLTLRGEAYRKGIGVHSRSELTYELNGRYRRFEATVGVDDETGGQGSVVFRVLLDGMSAWESPTLTGQVAPQHVRLDLKGARTITLIVDFGTLGDVQDHADWADAKLVR